MKKEKILDIIFTIIALFGMIEVSFIRGLFTGPTMMIVCFITGIIAAIYKIIKKEYHTCILYLIIFATIVMEYISIM